MSATDELRRMLDERGVIYTGPVRVGEVSTTWIDASLRPVTATPFGDGLILNAVLTPEQVVDVTTGREMGRETCHLTLKDDHEAYGEAFYIWWECDECGVTIPKTVGMPELRYCPSCGRRVVE